MNNQMELSFSAAAQNEAFARMVISAFLVQVNPKLSVVSEIRTAVSEAVTNSIVHAYSGDEGKVVMRARLDDTYVYIEIEDYARESEISIRRCSPFLRHSRSRNARAWGLR